MLIRADEAERDLRCLLSAVSESELGTQKEKKESVATEHKQCKSNADSKEQRKFGEASLQFV